MGFLLRAMHLYLYCGRYPVPRFGVWRWQWSCWRGLVTLRGRRHSEHSVIDVWHSAVLGGQSSPGVSSSSAQLRRRRHECICCQDYRRHIAFFRIATAASSQSSVSLKSDDLFTLLPCLPSNESVWRRVRGGRAGPPNLWAVEKFPSFRQIFPKFWAELKIHHFADFGSQTEILSVYNLLGGLVAWRSGDAFHLITKLLYAGPG